MIKDTDYLILFPFCRVVRGKERSLICNLQHKKIKFIPHQMQEVVNLLKTQTFLKVQSLFDGEDGEIFESYISFLFEHNFAFLTPHPERFPDIEPVWKSPERINNAIVEYDFSSYDILKVLRQLESLQCKFIEFRFVNFQKKNKQELDELLSFCQQSGLRSVRLYFPSATESSNNGLIELVGAYSIVESLFFYQHEQKSNQVLNDQNICYVTQSLDAITNASIPSNYLVNDLHYFFESQQFNPYYNKKVSIDRYGNIKNCIKNRRSFGNVNRDAVEKIIETQDFREFWHVHHDKIIDIKDNELRYNLIITHDLNKLPDGNYQLV